MRKFINPERELKENIRVTVEAENTKELKDLAKSFLGDDYDSFNQDFPEPTTECDGPECEPFKYEPDAFEVHDAKNNTYLDTEDEPEDTDTEDYADPFEKNPFDEEEPEKTVDFEAEPEDTDTEDEDDVELTPRAKALIDKTNKLAEKTHNKAQVMVDGKLEDSDEFEESCNSKISESVNPADLNCDYDTPLYYCDECDTAFLEPLDKGNIAVCPACLGLDYRKISWNDPLLADKNYHDIMTGDINLHEEKQQRKPRTTVRVNEEFDEFFDIEDPKDETKFAFEDDSNYYDTPEAQEASEYWASLNDLTDDDYVEYPEETVYDEDGNEIVEDINTQEKVKKDPKSATLPFKDK